MDSEQMDRLVAEAVAQGFDVKHFDGGIKVFTLGNALVIVRKTPTTAEEWRILLMVLTKAGLLWPPRSGR